MVRQLYSYFAKPKDYSINVREAEGHRPDIVSLPMGALDALRQIDAVIDSGAV